MDKIIQCKGACTKAYNTGNYVTYNDFIPIFQKYKISGMDFACDIKAHLDKLFSSPPKKTERKKKEHEKWYVYFYFLEGAEFPIYIGKSYNVLNRLKQHIKEDLKYKQIKTILTITFSSETDALDYERYYTEHFQPDWNISNRGNPPSYQLPKQFVDPWISPTYSSPEEANQLFQQYKIDQEKALKFQKLIDKISL